MRNYKILSNKDDWSPFGLRCFTEQQDQVLKINGFQFRDFPIKRYEKLYRYNNQNYDYVTIVLMPNDEYVRLYVGNYFLPCELKSKVGENYKKLMSIMKYDIKILKDIGVIK